MGEPMSDEHKEIRRRTMVALGWTDPSLRKDCVIELVDELFALTTSQAAEIERLGKERNRLRSMIEAHPTIQAAFEAHYASDKANRSAAITAANLLADLRAALTEGADQ